MTLRSEPKHSLSFALRPAGGVYLVEVHKPSAEFFAVASALTSLTEVGPRQLVRRQTDYLMPIRTWIADRASVRGALVTGYVLRPDGVKTPVILSDDGLNMDGAANDGIYGLDFRRHSRSRLSTTEGHRNLEHWSIPLSVIRGPRSCWTDNAIGRSRRAKGSRRRRRARVAPWQYSFFFCFQSSSSWWHGRSGIGGAC